MYAHVTTYRLGTSDEASADVARWQETGEAISDQTARTIASYWHSPSPMCRNITALSHGLPFDTEDLLEEIRLEVQDVTDADALADWTYRLEAILSDDV